MAVDEWGQPMCPSCGQPRNAHGQPGDLCPRPAAAPDPRFRDQTAEVLECANWCNSNYPSTGGGLSLLSPTPRCDCLETHRLPQADALLPLIAAEVEARIQAAAAPLLAKLRAVETLAGEAEKVREHNARTFGLKPLPARVGTDEIRRALDAS